MTEKIKTNAKNSKKYSKRERIRIILNDIEKRGWFFLPKLKEYSERFNVNVGTVSRDIKRIRDNIDLTDVRDFNIKMDDTIKKAIKVCNRILLDKESTPEQRIKAAMAIDKLNEGHVKFLEAYGYKKKIAEKLDVTQKKIVLKVDMGQEEEDEIPAGK